MKRVLDTVKFLGKTPSKISKLETKEDVLDYYLYFFEITWSNIMLSEGEEVKKLVLDKVNEVIDECSIEDISLEKYWWLLNLVMIRHFSGEVELIYLKTSIDLIFERYDTYTVEELEEITNTFNSALSSQIGELIATRPTEILKENLPILKGDFILKELLENKEDIIKIMSRSLRQKDFNKDSIKKILIIDRKVTKKFSTYWENIFDIFVIYFVSMGYEVFYKDLYTGELNYENINIKRVQSLIFAFFEGFLLDRDLGVKPTEDLADLIMELIENKYKIKNS